ncbi:hypothetical protein [Methylobacterium gossipiicola]|uniref:Uncharacterized protein n=1 Tax=Methylobacterium gossipiicola TaxID=582675 RepID=A0A1I2X274_9HYPH|nr:hypothetical protein [Methylobacterium gossipiicola]SFH07615.1 hypothetical protein SAMN05192565_13111 [Methylobacterium gossipiicola]
MIRPTLHPLTMRPISLGLLGISATAALVAGLWPLDLTAPAPPAATIPPLDLTRLATLDTGAAVTRPLFDPERRDWTGRGDRDSLTAEAPPPTLLSVKGILVDSSARRALVSDGTTPPAWLAPGEGRGAWRIVAIEPGEVVVADSQRRYTLAFLGSPVALQPVPRHPPKVEPPPKAEPPPQAAPAPPQAAPVPRDPPAAIRRIPITASEG